MVLNKNTLFCKTKIDLQQDLMVGHLLVIQAPKDLIIAQLEVIHALVELFQTLILNVVFMLESKFLEQMLK